MTSRVSASARTRPVALAALAALLPLAVACSGDDGGDEEARPPETSSTVPTTEQTTTTRPTTTTTRPAPGVAIAQARGDEIAVFGSPGAPDPARTLTAADVTSQPGAVPIVFLVAEQRPGWLKVHLPVRPNGSTGWVRAGDVQVSRTTFRVVVELAAHRITVYDDDEVVLAEPVGVGRSDRPTPGGVYYIKELLQPPSPGGPYGPYAYGLSGYSNVLQSFGGGQGVIGIHGTNEPSAIGQDVSSGCIRMSNDQITRLVEEVGLPLGTPVEIRA